jgi:hypothetical protein
MGEVLAPGLLKQSWEKCLELSEFVSNLPHYQITGMGKHQGRIHVHVEYVGAVACPHCGGHQ